MGNISWTTLIPKTVGDENSRKKMINAILIVGATIVLVALLKYKMILQFLRTKIGISLICIATALLVYAHIEPFFYKFTYNVIKVPKSFTPFTVVQLSDVHLQWPYMYVTESKLNKIVEKVNIINPDFIFITGDMISRYRTQKISQGNVDAVARCFSKLRAKRGIYAILGNNDMCAKEMYLEAMKRIGIPVLRGQTIIDNDISISGMDSIIKPEKLAGYLRALGATQDSSLKILLAHEPDCAIYTNRTFDLQFSGHTHGGQCVAPFGIGPIVTPKCGKLFPLGLYQVGQMLLYVANGIGISPLPKPLVRFNNIAEVPVIRVEPQ